MEVLLAILEEGFTIGFQALQTALSTQDIVEGALTEWGRCEAFGCVRNVLQPLTSIGERIVFAVECPAKRGALLPRSVACLNECCLQLWREKVVALDDSL